MKIAIAGGDLRMLHACKDFLNAGFDCACFGFDSDICKKFGVEKIYDLSGRNAIILPPKSADGGFLNTPLSKSKTTFDELFESSEENALFLVGGILPKKVRFVDYSKNEKFQLLNSVPTAEAAIEIALNELDSTLFGSNVVITGFGRIGSYLAMLLKSFGANVTTVSRSLKSRVQSEILGFNAVGFENFEAPLSTADIVFNTVPSKVFGERELKAFKKGTSLIDLASFPGGATKSEADEHGIKLITALGLPGKNSPKSAGKIIFKTALSIFYDWGLLQ